MGLPPDYVMDKMAMYEVKALLTNKHYKYMDDWEQSRLIAYIIAQSNSTKTLKFEDVVKFPWEKHDTPNTMSEEDFERLRKQADAMLNNNLI